MSNIVQKYTAAYEKLVPGEQCRAPMGVDAFLRGSYGALRPCKRIEKDDEHLVSVTWMNEPPSEDKPLTKDRVLEVCCYSAPALRKTLFGRGNDLVMRSFAPLVMNKVRRAVKAITAATYKQGSEAQQAAIGKLKREFDALAKQLLGVSIPRAQFHERLMTLLDELLSKFPSDTEQALFGQVTNKQLSTKLPAPEKIRQAINTRIEAGGYPAIHVAAEPNYASFMALQRQNVDSYVEQGLITPPREDDAIKNACLDGKVMQPHQQFVPLYLGAPESPYNGLVLFWNTGAGKTAGAWSLLRQYRDLEGWHCFWATKSSLMTDPLKDYNAFYDTADAVRPRVTEGKHVHKHNFYITSWKIFENSFVRGKNHQQPWRITCAERKSSDANSYFDPIWQKNYETSGKPKLGTDGKPKLSATGKLLHERGHPFARCVIVIDEAQYMYEYANLSTSERPTASCLQQMIFQAYEDIADPADYPKILLLSATPASETGKPFLQLCNLLIADPKRRFFPDGIPSDDAFPERFAQKYLTSEGAFTRDFEETIKGLVSCYDGRGNPTRFAETLRVQAFPDTRVSSVGAGSNQQQQLVNSSSSEEDILKVAAYLAAQRNTPANTSPIPNPTSLQESALAPNSKRLESAKKEYWDKDQELEVPQSGFEYDFSGGCFTSCDKNDGTEPYKQACQGNTHRWTKYTEALLKLQNDSAASDGIKAEIAQLRKAAAARGKSLKKYLGVLKKERADALDFASLNDMTKRWCDLFKNNPVKTDGAGGDKCESKESCVESCAGEYAKKLERDPAFVAQFFPGVDERERAIAIRKRLSEAGGIEDACRYLGVKLTAAILANVNAEELYNAPKLIALRNNIRAANASDMQKRGRQFKHYMFSSVPFAPGMIGAALQALVRTDNGEPWDFYVLRESNVGQRIELVHTPSNAVLAYSSDGPTQFNANFLKEVQEKLNRAPKNGLIIIDKAVAQQGSVLTDKGRNVALDAFNLRDPKAPKGVCNGAHKLPFGNSKGQLIQYAIVSKDYREGINLFDVKYVHLFEPQPFVGREIQALGRALRNCGQCGLPFDEGWRLYVLTYGVVGGGGEILEERARLFLQNKDNLEMVERLEDAYYAYAVTNAMQQCQRFVPKIISKLPWEGGEQEVAREAPAEEEMQQVKEAPELAAAAVERAYAAQEARERERLAGVRRVWQAQKDAYRERISAQAKLFNEAYKAKQKEVIAAIPGAVLRK